MPEYSSTTITPSDGVQVPGMNGSTSGNFLLSALKSYILSEKGLANGLASLDGNGKLLSSQLPDLADDVIVVASYASLPATGTAGKIYITADNNKMYRWDPNLETPDYVELSIDLSEYAKIVDIQDGNIQAGVAVKAFQDAMGRAIITTYETKADASDLKSAIAKNTAEIENLKQTSAQTEITVSYPDDGNYSALMPNLVPAKSAKYAEIKNIVGKSRAWNQLVQDKTSATIGGVTYTIDNTNHTVTVVASTAISSNSTFSFYVDSFSNGFKGIVGHKYLLFGQSFSEGYFAFFNNGGFNDSWYSHTTPQGFIVTCTDSTIGSGFVLRVLSGNTINRTLSYPIIRDLTLIFPEGVPATVAECVQKCPSILDYDAYGYSIVDNVVEGVKSDGVNIWDEVTENGYIDLTDGSFHSNPSYLSSKNYCACVPMSILYGMNTTLHGNPSSDMKIFFYDGSKNYIGYYGINETTITVPANAYFFKLGFSSLYGNSYHYDVQISLCPSGTATTANTTYHSYVGTLATLTLPSSVTLRSAGSVAEVYDLETGEKTNLIGSKDLSTLTWTYNGTFGCYVTTGLSGLIKPPSSTSAVPNALFEKYNIVKQDGSGTAGTAIVILNGNVWVYKSNDGSPSGYLYYELATPDDPTQLTPVTNNTLKVEPNGTVETVQTQSPVIDNSMTVNFDLIP